MTNAANRASHHDGQGHRPEHLALDAGQREDRQVDDQDDRDRDDGRPHDFAGGVIDDVEPFLERQLLARITVCFA
jgi:hypothetical protein